MVMTGGWFKTSFYPQTYIGWLDSHAAEDSSVEYEPWAISSWSRLRCAFRARPHNDSRIAGSLLMSVVRGGYPLRIEHNSGTSPLLVGKLIINGAFSIAM